MKNLKITSLLALALFLSLFTHGQERALSNIERNIHKDAAGLEQSLNFTLDTLTLKSDKNILRVTFLSHDEKDSVIIDVDAPVIKIPLYHFKKGRYTIAVYREDKIIALGVKRVEDIARPENAIADLEESILRSSLSKKEQINRNIKPLKTKDDTRVAAVKSKPKRDTRVAAVKPQPEKNKAKNIATPKKPFRVSKQRKSRVVSNTNKKSAFEIAAEREEAERVASINAQKDKAAVVFTKRKPEKTTTLIAVTKVAYNISVVNDKSVEKQSRADYRENNLRPNGTRYNN